MITVLIDRDSVHPGDDLISHKKEIKVQTLSANNLKDIIKNYELPFIEGNNYYWRLIIKDDKNELFNKKYNTVADLEEMTVSESNFFKVYFDYYSGYA